MSRRIDVIATTISGSVRDWGKIREIAPLFQKHGEDGVTVHAVDTHRDARSKACELVRSGCRILISAGGSGTFNSVVEGCYDSGIEPETVTLGFLRKGSADLIGKVLGMPDEVEEAVKVFVESIRADKVVPCDVLLGSSEEGDVPARHFVGYGGAEIFGEIPHYTENRFIKYYKGYLGQLFGDLGPFFIGTNLAILGRFFTRRGRRKYEWEISVDDQVVAQKRYQAMILVNGDLGPDLPFAKNVPLGSGDFYLFAITDKGSIQLYRQLKHAWDSTILEDPDRWGFESYRIKNRLVLRPNTSDPFPVNMDGSSLTCRKSARIEIVGRIRLLAR
jgi:diacylglycerol kinase family enzyme